MNLETLSARCASAGLRSKVKLYVSLRHECNAISKENREREREREKERERERDRTKLTKIQDAKIPQVDIRCCFVYSISI